MNNNTVAEDGNGQLSNKLFTIEYKILPISNKYHLRKANN